MVPEDLNLKNCQFTGLIKINYKLWRIPSKLTFKEISDWSDRFWQTDRGLDSKWCELFTAFVSLFWWCRCETRIGFWLWRLHFDFFLTSIRTSHHFCLRKSGIFKSENQFLSSWNQQFVIALKRRFSLFSITYRPKNAEKRQNHRVLYCKGSWFGMLLCLIQHCLITTGARWLLNSTSGLSKTESTQSVFTNKLEI